MDPRLRAADTDREHVADLLQRHTAAGRLTLDEYEQRVTAAWQANTGQFSPGFPAVTNDLSFITGQAVGDITGQAPKQEVLAGTASLDLQAFNVEGGAASTAWPKLTGGWIVATPVLGSLGTLDTGSSAYAEHENELWPEGATGAPTRTYIRFLERRSVPASKAGRSRR